MSRTGPDCRRVAIIGAVGVPANYGGFETLAENLVVQHAVRGADAELVVYCSSKAYSERPSRYHSATLEYVPLNANGIQSVLYDVVSMLSAVRAGADCLLLLGVSGAVGLPLIRAFSGVRVVTNIDGIEWRRAKWNRLARHFLRLSEKLAVRYSNVVISDNQAIADYVRIEYGVDSRVIAYGGDHAVSVDSAPVEGLRLPDTYALSVGRIEPENNVHLILEAFARVPERCLVFVGNWRASEYGRQLRDSFRNKDNIRLLDPIYDDGKLKSLRSSAWLYLHGHSAGGTNPSLVEIMHFGVPVVAFDCVYNRCTTGDAAFYFSNVNQLVGVIRSAMRGDHMLENGHAMRRIAVEKYTWAKIADQYFAELGIDANSAR